MRVLYMPEPISIRRLYDSDGCERCGRGDREHSDDITRRYTAKGEGGVFHKADLCDDCFTLLELDAAADIAAAEEMQ